MDVVLPIEIVVRILSFLPEKHLVRAKELNSNIDQIIRENRVYLRHPKIDIRFYDSNRHGKLVKLWINSRMIELDDMGEGIVSVKEEEWSKNSLYASGKGDFFGDLFEGQHNIRKFFDTLFDKGDIDLRMHCVRPLPCMHTLIESLNSTRSLIRSVTFNMASCVFLEVCDLLKAVGSLKKTKYYPRMICNLCIEFDDNIWEKFQRLNTIAFSFSSGIVQIQNIVKLEVENALSSIAREWQRTPFSLFHLHVSPIWSEYRRNEWDWTDMKITMNMTSVLMEDSRTGNDIEFRKIMKRYEEGGDTEHVVMIVAHLQNE